MNPDDYDIWDVNSAARKLIEQAHTVSARHLAHGIARVQFNREVAYYAKRIADDVALGHTTSAAMCVALGVPTGGLATLACGVVVVGAGSFASGAMGGALGEEMGEVVYEAFK